MQQKGCAHSLANGGGEQKRSFGRRMVPQAVELSAVAVTESTATCVVEGSAWVTNGGDGWFL